MVKGENLFFRNIFRIFEFFRGRSFGKDIILGRREIEFFVFLMIENILRLRVGYVRFGNSYGCLWCMI